MVFPLKITSWSFLIFAVVSLVTMNPSQVQAESVVYKKSWVKLVDTGLEYWITSLTTPSEVIWVTDHSLVANVAMGKEVHDPRRIGRTVMYDTRTGKTREIMRFARPVCWDAKAGRAGIVHYKDADDGKSRQPIALRIDSEGAILEMSPAAPNFAYGLPCDLTMNRLEGVEGSTLYRLRAEDGYLDLRVAGKGLKESAVLNRSDGKRIQLPVRSDQVSQVRYLDFLGSYQLNTGSGCLVQGEKCPPDIPLLKPTGDLSEVSVPDGVRNFISITTVYQVSNGLLFQAKSRYKKEGYLLLRNGVVHHLWQPEAPSIFGSERYERMESWGRSVNSPDGCKVAFFRGARPARLMIFDHCSIGN